MPKTTQVITTEYKKELSADNFADMTFKRRSAEEQHELLLKACKLLKECFIKV